LQWLELENFRSWQKIRFKFAPGSTLIVGPNASGKTNILEAIWLLAWLRSFRAKRIGQLINWGQNQMQLRAGVKAAAGEQQLGISLHQDGSAPAAKAYLVNGKPQSRRLFLQQFQAVIFRPEDIHLITGSPGRRRQFFDQFLAGMDWQYARAWRRYQRALRQRNKILEQWLRSRKLGPLDYWDQILASDGRLLQDKRRELLEFINNFWQDKAPAWLQPFQMSYQFQPLSLAGLTRRRRQDLARGHTSLGPQRDVFIFGHRQFPRHEAHLAYWASRGQQRLAILGLKLAIAAYSYERSGQRPLVLIDDVFSELDEDYGKKLLQLAWKEQTIWTATRRPAAAFWQGEIKAG